MCVRYIAASASTKVNDEDMCVCELIAEPRLFHGCTPRKHDQDYWRPSEGRMWLRMRLIGRFSSAGGHIWMTPWEKPVGGGCTCERRVVTSGGLGGGEKRFMSSARLNDGVDTRLLLWYKMEHDDTRVISLLRGCPQGVVVRDLGVIM